MSKSRNNARAKWLGAAMVALGLAVSAPAPATAQLLFDWGGGSQKVNDTGRLFVRMNTEHKPGEIIVSFSDRKLFLITAPGLAVSYPIAIPREQDRWQGQTSVTQKRENPSWTPTPTMIKENPKLPRWVPGGHPMNPLGNRALYLGSSLYRIHGTDAPWTIGTAVSKGCIRMYNKDALDVYERSKVGAKVLVTWKSYQFTPVEGQENIQHQPAAQQQEANAAGAAQGQSQSPSQQQSQAQTQTQPQVQPQVRGSRSTVSNIFDTGGVADVPARRRRQQAEAEPDFSSPPQPQAAASAPPTPEVAGDRNTRNRDNQQRRDASTRQRNTSGQTSGQSGTQSQQRTRDRANPASATAPQDPSAIETGAIAAQERDVAAVREPAAPVEKEAVRPAVVRQIPVKAQTQVAPPAATPEASPASTDDTSARVLQAAERAAVAAERAAAAAERAERAASRGAAAPAVPAAASAD